MILLEFKLLPLSICNLLLQANLMLEVLLLEFLELADPDQLLLMPRKSFAHRHLVLVLLSVVSLSIHKFRLAVAHTQLDTSWRQIGRSVLQEEVRAHLASALRVVGCGGHNIFSDYFDIIIIVIDRLSAGIYCRC